jgi:hypothetical protein
MPTISNIKEYDIFADVKRFISRVALQKVSETQVERVNDSATIGKFYENHGATLRTYVKEINDGTKASYSGTLFSTMVARYLR